MGDYRGFWRILLIGFRVALLPSLLILGEEGQWPSCGTWGVGLGILCMSACVNAAAASAVVARTGRAAAAGWVCVTNKRICLMTSERCQIEYQLMSQSHSVTQSSVSALCLSPALTPVSSVQKVQFATQIGACYALQSAALNDR